MVEPPPAKCPCDEEVDFDESRFVLVDVLGLLEEELQDLEDILATAERLAALGLGLKKSEFAGVMRREHLVGEADAAECLQILPSANVKSDLFQEDCAIVFLQFFAVDESQFGQLEFALEAEPLHFRGKNGNVERAQAQSPHHGSH